MIIFIPGERDAVNPHPRGTKVAPHYVLTVLGGGSAEIRVRFYDVKETPVQRFGAAFEQIFQQRKKEADEFYGKV